VDNILYKLKKNFLDWIKDHEYLERFFLFGILLLIVFCLIYRNLLNDKIRKILAGFFKIIFFVFIFGLIFFATIIIWYLIDHKIYLEDNNFYYLVILLFFIWFTITNASLIFLIFQISKNNFYLKQLTKKEQEDNKK
jgi:hypothetical protein